MQPLPAEKYFPCISFGFSLPSIRWDFHATEARRGGRQGGNAAVNPNELLKHAEDRTQISSHWYSQLFNSRSWGKNKGTFQNEAHVNYWDVYERGSENIAGRMNEWINATHAIDLSYCLKSSLEPRLINITEKETQNQGCEKNAINCKIPCVIKKPY